MLRIGVVTDNNDPDNMRRVKVQSVDRGVDTSDWVPRMTGWDGSDVGTPPIGSTVVISDLDGSTDSQVVIGVLQSSTTNTPRKRRGLGDWFGAIAGNLEWLVRGDYKLQIDRTVTIQSDLPGNPAIDIRSDGEIRMYNALGRISLLPSGYMRVVDPTGEWTTGGSGMLITHPSVINLQSPQLNWNGNRVAVVGGTDTDGDTTLS